MGRTYLFECPKCGYRARVAGGSADGKRFAVQTILCHDCRELYDAVTALKVALPKIAGDTGANKPVAGRPRPMKSAPPFAAVVNRLPLPARARARWQTFTAACPVSPRHQVRAWKPPDKCPRCGIFLESNLVPFREWD
jgi:predicted RNA-binding Zn-ribbon protein involved in translation (DUF1610 family)